MPKMVPIITTLTGGEMTPLLDSRVDYKKYATGCSEMQNFFPLFHGGAAKRPGTIFAAEVENSAKKPRLLGFMFSTEQAYALEFGEDSLGAGYIRPWKKSTVGVYGVITKADGSVVKITAPYLADDVEGIQFTQTADEMYLFHPDYPPYKLSRTSHTAWTLAVVEWGTSMTAPTGGSVTTAGTSGSTTYDYQMTCKDSSGNESLPCATVSVGSGNATLSTSNYNKINWTGYNSNAAEIVVYRGYDGIFKYIGNAAPTKLYFKDTGQDYDATLTPPAEYLPFASNGNYPRCGSFYQDRLWLGGSNNSPQTLYGSRTGDHENMNLSSPTQDADSVEFTLLSNDVSLIKWMTPGRGVFMLGTASAAWMLKTTDSGAITPTNVDASPQAFEGCNSMKALQVGGVLLFPDRLGKQVLEFAYDLATDGYLSPDIMILSEHLTRDNTLKEWCYARSPHRIVASVRDDGVGVCMTYSRDQQVSGWWRFVTDGAIESVCAIPGDDRDEIWLVVKRTINGVVKRYVEVLAPSFSDDETCEDAFFVDCGATLDNWNSASNAHLRFELASSGGTWATDDEVFIYATGTSIGYASNVGRSFGLRNADGTICRAKVKSVVSTSKVAATLATPVPLDNQDVANTAFARMVTSLSGVTWLEGKTVDLLGDGKKLPSQTVTSGAVTLSQPCAKVQVGLNYAACLTPHAVDSGFQDGTSVGRKAQTSRITLRLYQSYGLKAGPKNGELNALTFSTSTAKMGAPLKPFSGDKDVFLDSVSETSPQIRIKHDEPLPCTILSITQRVHGTGG